MNSVVGNKAIKIAIFTVLSYVLIVAVFESSLGYFQPENASTLQISTTAANGQVNRRIVARLESGGQLYVAANHWPRAWYREALANPSVMVNSNIEQGSFVAVPVEGNEHQRVNADNSLGFLFRFLTGFPPRYFLRLESQG